MTSSPLITDLYQLTMAQAYFRLGMRDTAVFELFVRRLPAARRTLVFAGLDQVLDYLETLRFEATDLAFLAGTGLFAEDFLAHLAGVRFTGSVHALPEGTPFFADEPVLRVTAPILEAQLVESRLLNLAHFQTLIASKAVRCVHAAAGRGLIDFGMRRAHGAEAAVLAARAAYLAGFDGTATVAAGQAFGIPLSGTMAHSFVEAHDREADAFANFLQAMDRPTTLLVDTYDTERAARRVAEIASRSKNGDARGRVQAVRIDSGDLDAQARAVRRILDEGGCPEVGIVLSGNLDEDRIAALVAAGTPATAFGVGTHLDVSVDAPALDMAYKLQEYAGRARRKRSPGKRTWPGIKQVFRVRDDAGRPVRDCIGLADEALPGTPMLAEVMHEGRRLDPRSGLARAREHCRREIAALPDFLRSLDTGGDAYAVEISDAVRALAASVDARDA